MENGSPILERLDRQLLDACRRDFPICEKPFAEIARRLDESADEVLRRLDALERCGVLSWIGPVLKPGAIGANTLVAMAVPDARLRSVRATVLRHPGVGEVLEREHEFNLWFSLAAPNEGELFDTVADIRRRTGVEVLDLRLERDYRGRTELPSPHRTASELCGTATETPPPGRRPALDASDRRLLTAVQEGLPVTPRPYAAVANRLGVFSEAWVIERLKGLASEGLITRMGVVMQRDPPRLEANALVVFDVSPRTVDTVGERLAEAAWIDRCHRRIPRAPFWPYNLYCTLNDRDLARLFCWVDERFFGTARCQRRSVLFCRACHGARGER
ncbi:MAG: AsnC family transcriptional regulator [Gammaproteobacteria bacterium]|nr:AsnC family transcriptional regulator [Gammaproteobacteria bacterium]